MKPKNSEFAAVRVMLMNAQLDALVKAAEAVGCNVVPLKGIALLQTLYKESLDRPVGDIDILVWPQERVREYVNCLERDGYTAQFDFLADDATLAEKRKIALRSTRKERTDVDIHLAFVTKKFFSLYCEDFNRDAIQRCRRVGENLYCMDDLDQWLFLAQHACFHLYRDEKWLMDLRLLYNTLTEEQLQTLHERAHVYGFRRITFLSESLIGQKVKGEGQMTKEGDGNQDFSPSPFAFSPPLCWRKFVHWSVRHWHSRLVKRLVNPFWELIFIDKACHRRSAHRRLLFPSLQQMKAIYRTKYTVLTLLLYPFHVLVAGLGLSLFYALYGCSIFRKG